VSAEERSLFRGRSSRPSKGRQVSFAPRWSMLVVLALKGSFPFGLQPEFDQAADGFGADDVMSYSTAIAKAITTSNGKR
jgi:hypothetical protein